MNIVEQVIAMAEASGKVVWAVFLASAAVLVVEHYVPDLFVGLPAWALPTLRILAIFTSVLAIASVAGSLLNYIRGLGARVLSPIRKRNIKKRLMDLDQLEVAVLCKALAEDDRDIWIKPDLAVTLSLQDKGLVEPFFSGVGFGDGTSSYSIPMDVWRILLVMDEFRLHDKAALVRALTAGSHFSEARVLSLLPQAHPAVRTN